MSERASTKGRDDDVGIRETLQETAAPYGIIDPDYARVFTIARCIAWSEGYAMVLHGSFTRDLDLLAVPWTEQATDADHLVKRIALALDDLSLLVKDASGKTATEKPHGRLSWTLTFKTFGDPRFVDLSVMPRNLAKAHPQLKDDAARVWTVIGWLDGEGCGFTFGSEAEYRRFMAVKPATFEVAEIQELVVSSCDRAIAALGDTKALENRKAVRADATPKNPLSEGRERS